MTIRIRHTDLHVLNMHTRMPFKYGIATLTALPHLFVRVQLELDGKAQYGIAADGLPPKWFTKDPAATFRDELAAMFAVIRSACFHAQQAPPAATVFDLWQRVHGEQHDQWSAHYETPPLLWSLGVSLVERAMIDAFCRASGASFATALRRNTLGIRLGDIHRELGGAQPAELLPGEPLRSVIARHTVGLADPITDADVAPGDRLDDGLPQSLEACIAAYGLTHFKIKLSGNGERDLDRLKRLAAVIGRASASGDAGDYAFTLDGNEQYEQVEPFAQLWRTLAGDAALAPFMQHLLFVEQPFHRDVALSDALGRALAAWADRPAMIIDESDGSMDSARIALDRGYAGTSHKNCKGVFKGVANACLIAQRRKRQPERRLILSGEDLANVGPVALVEDLAAVASLGITHVERNGHHYFRGLSMLPAAVQDQVLQHHGDLYHRHARGFAALNVHGGRIDVASVVDAPFGPAFDLDPTHFTPADEWRFESLED